MDFSQFTLEQLYERYNSIDKEVYKEEAEALLNEIKRKQQQAPFEKKEMLADRGDRLFASLLDGFFMMIPMIFILLFIVLTNGFDEFLRNEGFTLSQQIQYFLWGQVIFLTINGYLLYTSGQTVGKKILKIRIVNSQGEVPSIGRLYGLRYLLMNLFGFIPVIGSFIYLIDVLFIFREDRRCLHDMIAETKVVPV